MDIKRFTNFRVLILVLIVTLTTVFLPNSIAQNYTQWDLPEGAKARLGKGTITEIAYSPDGTRLAVSGSRGVWIYDAQSGDELDLLTGHQGELLSVSYSPDGQTLASGGLDGIIRLWDVDTGTLKRTLTGHSQSVLSVSFSPDGKTLASGSWDTTILLWDTSTFVPDPEDLADVNADGVVNIQDLVRVAARIGQQVPADGDLADVNGDGVINIQDLVQVAGAIGN